ncbi:hypothetical protein HYH02_013160 [Chlamydomonas schloesseri]|uniref:Uncharacterized protein n=1 Tax=Chlamydomonas schloesseri TaxID=2026947 RepID=A0A835SUU0_9CHLO|nr:hypothetical protein HYH02_013160 [Chlamydomonas schloesseri]|eukprot:KAG2431942.1 hypothetical protein HYH02_013160 [Chlamydomonas schloesseri]
MPPPVARVTSFSVDIEDWHSCTPSDDDAYQEALERNSNASFFTCRTHAPSSVVSAAQNEPESPTRLQDAEAALAGLVPESLSEAKLQHAAPALEPSDTPAAKKTKSAALPPTASAAGAPRSKPAPTRRTTPLRSASLRTTCSPSPAAAGDSAAVNIDTAAAPAAAISDAEATLVRVHIIPRPDDTGVQLQILPSVLCLFGSVPFPAPSASSLDFAAALLLQAGGRSEAVSSAGGAALTPAPSVGSGAATGASPAAQAAVPPQASEGGASAAGEDPIELKDQSSKVRRGAAAGKATAGGSSDKNAQAAGLDLRKSQAAFPGSMLLKRIFSGFNGNNASNSNTGSMPAAAASAGIGTAAAAPPPASVQELGAELLAARGCCAADGQLAGAAAASATVVAGYVQAAAAGAGSVPASPGAGISVGTADAAAAEAEAAAAVHRMSTDMFRNVLRASGGGGGADVASPGGKVLRSPRDTAFSSAAAAAKAAAVTASPRQRDQAPAAHAADTGSAADGSSTASCKNAQAATPARTSNPAGGAGTGEGSPCKDEQSEPGVAALALLAGLATPPAPQVPASIRTDGGAGLAAAGSLEMLAPGQSGDMSEGGGLPMPDLEKCESPVMAKAAASSGGSKLPGGSPPPLPAVPLAAAVSEEVADAEEVTLSVAQEPEQAAAAAEAQGAPVLPVPTSAAGAEAAVAESGATASPRTVSKKAYGTVANVVRKMVPGFRDSALMALASSTEAAAAPTPPPPRPPVAPRAAKVPAGPKAAAPVTAAVTVAGVEAAAPEAKEAPQGQADGAVQSPGAPMFIFGQEQPKTAKTPVIRPRPISAKPPAASPAGGAGEPTTPVDAAGRKRKSELEDLPIAKMPVSAGKTASTSGVGVISPGGSTAPEAPSPLPAATAAPKSAAEVPVVAPAPSAKQAEAAAPRDIAADASSTATEAAPQATVEPVRAPLRHSVTSEIEEVTLAPQPVPAAQPVAPAAQAQALEAQPAVQQPPVKPAAAGEGKKPTSGGLFACFGCFKA